MKNQIVNKINNNIKKTYLMYKKYHLLKKSINFLINKKVT
jgi:hypothetical protein